MEVKGSYIHLTNRDIDAWKAMFDDGDLHLIQIEHCTKYGKFVGYKVHLQGNITALSNKFKINHYKINKDGSDGELLFKPETKRADFMYEPDGKLADKA